MLRRGRLALSRLVNKHLAALFVVTCITAWFSYAYFHPDEYFQVIEYARAKLGFVDPKVLPWEYAQRMRPWLQPFIYFLIGRGLGIRDVFAFAFACRLVTGIANVGAVAMFLRTTLPWFRTDEEKLVHLRVVTCLGFLPYLFVRTSSESGSMAALTAAFALVLRDAQPRDDGRKWTIPSLEHGWRLSLVGVLFGVAFECRFQTAFFALGLVAWLVVIGGARGGALARVVLGGVASVLVGALIDRWGYGTWTFPPWTYFQANLLEGAASLFGRDPLLSYFWMLSANIFAPVVLVLLALAVVAWLRSPRHPVTWVTLPFFVIHSLIAHKEERFLFPIAVVSTALVTMALGPSFGPGALAKVTCRVARWGWERRWAWPGKVLAVVSTAGMVLLTFFAIGWNHNVRFTRFLHDSIGNEFYATALPEIPAPAPAFHSPVWEVDKADPEEIVRRIAAGQAREWLVTDRPSLQTGTILDSRAVLVFSELPFFRYPAIAERERQLIDAYNARAPMALRRLHFRSLYRIVP